MLSIKNKINNPMTVIATFALISETSAAVSLPFLDNEERQLYVWFLISFPFYLLFLFFLTLNFNYRSLYAPSDFAEDDNFLKALDEVVPNNEKQKDNPGDTVTASSGVSDQYTGSKIDSPHPSQVPDPPDDDVSKPRLWFEHAIQLPKTVGVVRVIDVRQMSTRAQFDKLLTELQRLAKQPCKFLVFLTNQPSDALLKQTALRQIKQLKKGMGTTRCIAYNAGLQVTTILRWD